MPIGNNHRELRRARRQINQGVRSFQQMVGDLLLWFEYDEQASSTDAVYTEGPVPGITFNDMYGNEVEVESRNLSPAQGGNLWRGPITVPAVWVRYIAPRLPQSEDGTYLTATITARLLLDQLRKSGLGHPADPADHLDDRFAYKNKPYRVSAYEPIGWIAGQYFMIDVTGTELKEAELMGDPFPFWQTPTTPWSPNAQMNWPSVPMSDWGQ